jgi:molybdopterin-guanine dinucleotide biosynthesis protein A
MLKGVEHLTKEGTALILCGGKSRRMGFDKSDILINGVPLIKITYENLMEEFEEVILVADKKDKFSNCDYKVVEDVYKECGPLGGIYSGLINSSSSYSFVIACDMPFISRGYIKYMKSIMKIEQPDCVVSLKNGFIEPFYSLFKRDMAGNIEKSLASSRYKTSEVIRACNSHFVDEETIRQYAGERDIFTNMNYTDELKILSQYDIKDLAF